MTLRGSVQCSQPALVRLYGQLKQRRGRTAITGEWSALVPCDGVSPWTASVQPEAVLFRGRAAALFAGGKAEVTGIATARDPDNGVVRSLNLGTVITLRGK